METAEKVKTQKQIDREQKKVETILTKMSKNIVQTFSGKTNLRKLAENVGVAYRTEYWNNIEVRKSGSIANGLKVEKVVHDYGLIFRNGFEIRHVDKIFFNYFQVPIVAKRERKV